AAMDSSSPSVEPVLDFASSGRTGRRNALPDILGSPAGVSPSDLPLKLAEMSLSAGGCWWGEDAVEHPHRCPRAMQREHRLQERSHVGTCGDKGTLHSHTGQGWGHSPHRRTLFFQK
uniref:cAMP-dependent protein kinase inhibitor beta n=1 Tax=Meleagris gallopavo TaxID=9103 RepID=A0A803YLA5_MELGA